LTSAIVIVLIGEPVSLGPLLVAAGAELDEDDDEDELLEPQAATAVTDAAAARTTSTLRTE
jgi:hypothetical protein